MLWKRIKNLWYLSAYEPIEWNNSPPFLKKTMATVKRAPAIIITPNENTDDIPNQ